MFKVPKNLKETQTFKNFHERKEFLAFACRHARQVFNRDLDFKTKLFLQNSLEQGKIFNSLAGGRYILRPSKRVPIPIPAIEKMNSNPNPNPTFRKNESQSQSQKFSSSIPIPILKFSEFNPNPKNLSKSQTILKNRSQSQKFGICSGIPWDWDPSADPWLRPLTIKSTFWETVSLNRLHILPFIKNLEIHKFKKKF